ncbi:MAG: TolB family protein, partial [Planctomycetota bacterium]
PSHIFRIGSGARRFPEGGGFNGDIDEVQIFNRRLSATEIKSVFKKPGAVRDGLTGWFKFEDEAKDSSGNNNDGRVFRAETIKGKTGRALRFTERSRVQLPVPEGTRARSGLWDLVRGDFDDDQSATEMERERSDGIWAGDWEQGDFKGLAERYAAATFDVGGLPQKAGKLVSTVHNSEDLEMVRDIYHLSIANRDTYSSLSAKVKTIRPAITHLAKEYGQRYSNAAGHIAQLETIEKRIGELATHPADAETIKRLNKNFGQLQYTALVTDNPLMDFDRLLFIKRYSYQSSHYYTDFIDGTENPGGNLCILSMKDGKVTELIPSMAGGIFGRYDLSFDGKSVVCDWKEKIGKGFRIFDVGIDGAGLRKLTFEPPDEAARIEKYNHHDPSGTARVYEHHTDDMHPCYLPDGRIVFTSTRCEYGVLCDGPDKLTSSILYRIDGNGKNMVKLTNSAVSEFSPAIMHDGRIIYNRWEYVDKGQIGVKCLWAMRPDGSGTAELFGNDIALPPVFNHGRPIPGYNNNLFVTLGTPHFPQSGVGTVIRLDINKPIRTREPMTYITPDIDIRTEGGFHHRVGDGWERTPYGPLYMDPLPLSEKFYLVSYNPDKIWNDVRAYGLYLLDEFGNHILIYKDKEFSCWQPTPLRPRKVPAVLTSTHDNNKNEPAIVVLSDVYVGLEGVERGTIKYIRIMEQVPRPWDCRRFWDEGAPGVSAG